MDTVVDVVTAKWVTDMVALDAPAGTFTVDGIAITLGLLDLSWTVEPPTGAGPVRTTVPTVVAEEPPTKLLFVKVMPWTPVALIVQGAD